MTSAGSRPRALWNVKEDKWRSGGAGKRTVSIQQSVNRLNHFQRIKRDLHFSFNGLCCDVLWCLSACLVKPLITTQPGWVVQWFAGSSSPPQKSESQASCQTGARCAVQWEEGSAERREEWQRLRPFDNKWPPSLQIFLLFERTPNVNSCQSLRNSTAFPYCTDGEATCCSPIMLTHQIANQCWSWQGFFCSCFNDSIFKTYYHL